MSDKILHTGGALGTDLFFTNICNENGFIVKIHSFEAHTIHGIGDIITHTSDELCSADKDLEEVSLFLKRPFPNKNNHINNLLRRNYLIIRDVETVYAIANLQSPYIVEGGTGWGCELARKLDKLIFLFNLKDNRWYTSGKNTNYWPLACKTPKLTYPFAGIGTRSLNKHGKQAIKNLLVTLE